MNKLIRFFLLASGFVLVGNLAMGDFYVIPTIKKMFAPVARTGQTDSYAVWDDGDLQKGVAWPNPRFTDNGNGTVTDNLTGLVWMQNASCGGTRTWSLAVAFCALLSDQGSCGLDDGSNPGDWRLPNLKELQSLIYYRCLNPAVPNTAGTGQWTAGDPFNSVQPSAYWSSSTYAGGMSTKWDVSFASGVVYANDQDDSYHAWCVRDPR